MLATGGEGEGAAGGGPINRKKWLEDNRLKDVAQIFEDRDILIEELVEFDEEELVEFARELGLDTLSRKRFIKAVSKLKAAAGGPAAGAAPVYGGTSMGMAPMSTSGFGAAPPAGGTLGTARTVGESAPMSTSGLSALSGLSAGSGASGASKESLLMEKLLRRYESSKKLLGELEAALPQLKASKEECAAKIKAEIATIVESLKSRKVTLSESMAELKETKRTQLTAQLTSLQAYKKSVESAKMDYERIVGDASVTAAERKLQIDAIMEGLKKERPPMVLVTQPKVKFTFDQEAFNAYLKGIVIDDCDTPKPALSVTVDAKLRMILTVFSNGGGVFAMAAAAAAASGDGSSDLITAKKPLKALAVEYAVIRKFKQKSDSESSKKKKKRKKKKKYDSSSDDSSDSDSSDSSSDSDSSDESKSDSDDDSDDSDDSSDESDDSSSEDDSDADSDDSDDEKKESSDDDSSDDSSSGGKKKKKKKGKKKKGGAVPASSSSVSAVPGRPAEKKMSKKKLKKLRKKELKKINKSYTIDEPNETATVIKEDAVVVPDGIKALKKDSKKKKKKRSGDADSAGDAGLGVSTVSADGSSSLDGIDPSKLEDTKVEWSLLQIEMIAEDDLEEVDGSSDKSELTIRLSTKIKPSVQYVFRTRLLNDSGWGRYQNPVLHHVTPAINIESKIMSAKEITKLMSIMPKKCKTSQWKLLFRAKKHGFSGQAFHSKCDGKRGYGTVTVIKSTTGNIFGGYTSMPWSSNNTYMNDTKAFLFLLKSKSKQKTGKYGLLNPTGQSAVYHYSSYGPTFGAGNDLYLCNNCNTLNQSYCQPNNTFTAPTGNSYISGGYNFTVTDYEVFLVKK